MLDWIRGNAHWVFSGIGVLAISAAFRLWWPRLGRDRADRQLQLGGGESSEQLQVGGREQVQVGGGRGSTQIQSSSGFRRSRTRRG